MHPYKLSYPAFMIWNVLGFEYNNGDGETDVFKSVERNGRAQFGDCVTSPGT
jgi:hypothetical protein